MSALFAKMNLKAHTDIAVLNAPASFEAELAALEGVTVRRRLGAKDRITFGLAFAVTNAELDAVSTALTKAADGDAILWIAYPKGTSKRFKGEFNRDSEWRVLTDAGYETVRMVAIDADWSALRFRKSAHVRPRLAP